jgi:L-amino acid N-acyltransferase YncA
MKESYKETVLDILNFYVKNSFAAYPEVPVEQDLLDQYLEMSKGYPAVVAKTGSDEIVGVAFLHQHIPLKTFNRTAEITYFILPEHTRKGLGKMMLDYLIEQHEK